MLATQLLPAASLFSTQREGDGAQYRPVKTIEAFNALLPPPIEFIEGSSSGILSLAESKYEPINGSGGDEGSPDIDTSMSTISESAANTPTKRKISNAKRKELYTGELPVTWPPNSAVGAGFHNTGNTCFLNSALQCLIYTAPLAHAVMQHGQVGGESCRAKGVCVTCQLQHVIRLARGKKGAFVPAPITTKLQVIAKHMRRGRQEDSHEFLRYLIDGLQKSSLAGLPPKVDPKIAETTWVHKVFGGRLRSRVTCRNCGHNSDTFDRVLDLSVDIHGANDLREAMKGFTNVDILKGADKYKCEKCKKHVVAEKRFSIHEAPLVLTIHLKRFSPLGRKIAHPLRYDTTLRLQPYMSDNQHGPTYSLYGVISHAGGGPNSGHYYAHVRASDGRWYEMNDDSVTQIGNGAPTGLRSAYILFYIRSDIGTAGVTAEETSPTNSMSHPSAIVNIRNPTPRVSSMVPRPVSRPGGIVAGMKRRNEDGGETEQRNGKVARTNSSSASSVSQTKQIGPLLPSGAFVNGISVPTAALTTKPDPQAKMLSERIRRTSNALQDLSNYDDSNSDEEAPEECPSKSSKTVSEQSSGEAVAAPTAEMKDLAEPTKISPNPVPAASFYSVGTGPEADVPATTGSSVKLQDDARGLRVHGDEGTDNNYPFDGSFIEGADGSWMKVRKGGPSSVTPDKLGIRPRAAKSSKQEKWKQKFLGKGKHRGPWDGRKGDTLHERREDIGSPSVLLKQKKKKRYAGFLG